MRWTTAEIAAAVDGTLIESSRLDGTLVDNTLLDEDGVSADAVVSGVTQDSREIGPRAADGSGHLFVPLIAERDGHHFVDAALAAGAVATLSDRDLSGCEVAVIRVADTALALAALGNAARARLADAMVIGVTGSVGKTTTKDLLAAVFAEQRRTYANARSFNNEIGLPLALLAAPEDSEIVILELGARGVGHIAELCKMARPTVGVITTVAAVHTSEFGSIEAVARAKGELIENLPAATEGGLAVLNAAQPRVVAMADRTEARVITYGAGGDVRAEEVVLDADLTPRFRLVSEWGSADVVLGARGLHLVDNALAAAATALTFGLVPEEAARGLAHPMLSAMRMDLLHAHSGATILDDSYNANPLSTEAALRSLAHLGAARRTAVLGEMAELGAESSMEHRRMADIAADLGIRVIAVDAPDYDQPAVEHVADLAAAVDRLGVLDVDDAVLVKGSRVVGLERLVEQLVDRPAD